MGRSMQPRLVETCYKVATTRNKFGQFDFGAAGDPKKCLYRPINEMRQGSGNREEVLLDGIFWLSPDDGWQINDTILYNSEYFRIDRIIEAKRRVKDNATHFIKAEVMRTRQVS